MLQDEIKRFEEASDAERETDLSIHLSVTSSNLRRAG
jgi:hypothetical protein